MIFPFHYFRSGYRRLKRFIVWFPVIWHDEDWDSAYLFKIMQFKISRIRKEITKNKIHLYYENHIRQMKVAEELLDRISFSDFYYNLSEQIENAEKQGKCICPEETWASEPYISKSGEHIGSRLIDLSCNYCKDSSMRWHKRKKLKEKEDLDFLFLHLKKHAQKWWD